MKPRRVIEDPDFDKMPSYASKGKVSSRLFKDDDSGKQQVSGVWEESLSVREGKGSFGDRVVHSTQKRRIDFQSHFYTMFRRVYEIHTKNQKSKKKSYSQPFQLKLCEMQTKIKMSFLCTSTHTKKLKSLSIFPPKQRCLVKSRT